MAAAIARSSQHLTTMIRDICKICGEETDKKCSMCRKAIYCGPTCQKRDWSKHKLECKSAKQRIDDLKEIYKKLQPWQQALLRKDFDSFKITAIHNEPFNQLPMTEDRELLFLLAFQYQEKRDIYSAYDRVVSGMKIIKNDGSNQPGDPNDCSNFVFGEYKWYNKGDLDLLRVLFNTADKTLPFLQSKNYITTNSPKEGDIVVYASGTQHQITSPIEITMTSKPIPQITHYGRIVSITRKGNIVVQSKFGCGDIFQHNLELVPFFYGNHYTFLTKQD